VGFRGQTLIAIQRAKALVRIGPGKGAYPLAWSWIEGRESPLPDAPKYKLARYVGAVFVAQKHIWLLSVTATLP